MGRLNWSLKGARPRPNLRALPEMRKLMTVVVSIVAVSCAACGGDSQTSRTKTTGGRAPRATNAAERRVRPCLRDAGFDTQPTKVDSIVRVLTAPGSTQVIALIQFDIASIDELSRATSGMSKAGLVVQAASAGPPGPSPAAPYTLVGFKEQFAKIAVPVVQCAKQASDGGG